MTDFVIALLIFFLICIPMSVIGLLTNDTTLQFVMLTLTGISFLMGFIMKGLLKRQMSQGGKEDKQSPETVELTNIPGA